MCYFQLKDYDNAIRVLENVSLDKLNNTTLNNLGAVLIDGKSYNLASNYLHQVIINDPLYKCIKNLAFLNKELGNDLKIDNFI